MQEAYRTSFSGDVSFLVEHMFLPCCYYSPYFDIPHLASRRQSPHDCLDEPFVNLCGIDS